MLDLVYESEVQKMNGLLHGLGAHCKFGLSQVTSAVVAGRQSHLSALAERYRSWHSASIRYVLEPGYVVHCPYRHSHHLR